MTERSRAQFSDDQVSAIGAGVRSREGTRERAGTRAIDRVEIVVVGGLQYEARNLAEPDAPMSIGEPVERGGTGRGASPLAHFLAGAGACLLNQFVRVAVTEGYPVSFTRTNVRGEFRRDAGAGIQRILCEVYGEGDLSDEIVEELAGRAERLCYVHCTLSRAVEMTTVLVIGGRERLRRVAGPDTADR